MKKLLVTVLVITLVLASFAGCANDEEVGAETPDVAETIKIGVTNSTLKESVYLFMKDNAQKICDEEGVELIWQSSENDPTLQANQMENFVTQGAKAIVIESVKSETAADIVKLAQDAGIPVINLEAEIKGIKMDLRIGADNYAIGVLQAEKVYEVWGDKPANVIVLSGTKGDESAESITLGVLDTLKKYPNFKVVYEQAHSGWDRQLAMNSTENALVQNNKDIQIVIANNDTMMHGALKAAQNAGVDKEMMFFGSDFDKDSAELLLEGVDNIFVVDRGSIVQGERIAQAAIALARGEAPEYDVIQDSGTPFWQTPINIVDMNNIEEFCKGKYPELVK